MTIDEYLVGSVRADLEPDERTVATLTKATVRQPLDHLGLRDRVGVVVTSRRVFIVELSRIRTRWVLIRYWPRGGRTTSYDRGRVAVVRYRRGNWGSNIPGDWYYSTLLDLALPTGVMLRLRVDPRRLAESDYLAEQLSSPSAGLV